MKRLPDWRSRLFAYIDDARARPFAWGRHDCAFFAAGAVEAMTGEDFAAGFRGRYTTPRGALIVLRRAGFVDLASLAGSRLPEIHPSQARAGDVVAFPTHDALGLALGVAIGERSFVLRPDGMGTLLTLDAVGAFRT